MRVKQFLLPMIMMTLAVSCANGQPKAPKSENAKKILVVYYSWGGNTQEVARQIQKTTGGDIFEIVPAEAYPEEYQACVDQAKQEIKEGVKPALKSKVENLESYDVVFVGTPNWWSTIAPPVATFLSEHNLAGKTVIPFCTHGGGGIARCFSDMAKLCPESKMMEKGLAVSGNNAKSAQGDVDKWLKEIGIVE